MKLSEEKRETELFEMECVGNLLIGGVPGGEEVLGFLKNSLLLPELLTIRLIPGSPQKTLGIIISELCLHQTSSITATNGRKHAATVGQEC